MSTLNTRVSTDDGIYSFIRGTRKGYRDRCITKSSVDYLNVNISTFVRRDSKNTRIKKRICNLAMDEV